MKSQMKLYPFGDVVREATARIEAGADVYQQFICAGCGAKQTMDVANTFYKRGGCEECGHQTNIEKDGMNYMLTIGSAQPARERDE